MTELMGLTVTQRLRRFLAQSGHAVTPWSSVDEVMDRLYGLLYERREQAGLWADLVALLDALRAEARGMLASPDAEILSQAHVDELVAELRRAMRVSREAPAAGAMRRFSVGKSAAVLACIALLAAGSSLGCGSSSSSHEPDAGSTVRTDASQTSTADVAPSGSNDGAADSADAPMDLVRDSAIEDIAAQFRDAAPEDIAAQAEASVDARTVLDAPRVDVGPIRPIDGATSQDALIDLFRDGSPEDIAAKLEAAVDNRPDLKIMPIYKGVAFPA